MDISRCSLRTLTALLAGFLLSFDAAAFTNPTEWRVVQVQGPGVQVPGSSTHYPTKQAAQTAMRGLAPTASEILTKEDEITQMSLGWVRYKYVAPTRYPDVTNFEYWYWPPDVVNEGVRFASEPQTVAAFVAYYTDFCGIAPSLTPLSNWAPVSDYQGSALQTDSKNFEVDFNGGCISEYFLLTVYRERHHNCPTGYSSPAHIGIDTNGNEYPPEPCRSDFSGFIEQRPLECPVAGKFGRSPFVGNPCDVSTGDKSQVETDYSVNGLEFARYYHSGTLDSTSALGTGWSHNYSARLVILAGAPQGMRRPDGRHDALIAINGPTLLLSVGGIYVQPNGTQWIASLQDGSMEIYGANGELHQKIDSTGKATTLNYANGRLASIVGAFGHTLQITYAGELISGVSDPSGNLVSYAYQNDNLTQVTFQDGRFKTYHYENATFPHHLTGITDEAGARFATYGYDSTGRAQSSTHAGGAGEISITYSGNTSTVLDAAGATTTYTFTSTSNRARRVASVSKEGITQNYQVPNEIQRRVSQTTDARGITTNYTYDTDHLTSMTVAVGTPVARTTTFQYGAFEKDLPTLVTTPGRAISYSYDAYGNVLSKTVTDTSTSQSRTWNWTYTSAGQLETENGPRTDLNDVTTYAYYTCTTGFQCGQLHTITNALGHVTTFSSYNAHAQPTQITDANGLVTNLAYDLRNRMTHRCDGGTLPGCSGGELTQAEYWPTGQLKKATIPDGSFIEYTYDAAHRLTEISDAANNRIVYTLDDMGNRIAENAYDPNNVLKRTHSRVFNTLNQFWKDVKAAGTAAVTTTFGYDNNGNQVSVAAPLGRSSSSIYDELNRLTQMTDPAAGVTHFGYDALDNLTSVTDPEGLVTTYQYNGLGDLALQTSPDSGQTTLTYDSGGNVHTRTDARGTVSLATYSYDALNRPTQVVYSDRTITYTFDNCLNGVGRLCSFVDAGDSASYQYDLHGRVTQKTQMLGSGSFTHTRVVKYGYTNGLLTSIQYPSGTMAAFVVHYEYDPAGRISAVSWTPDGNPPAIPILSNVQYDPFGGVRGWTWANGTAASREFDLDGRPTNVASAGGSIIGYDDADRLRTITPTSGSSVPAGTFDYDSLDRLTSSIIGGQSQGFTYDKNGNRLSQTDTPNGTYTYPHAGGTGPLLSNRLSSVSGGTLRANTYDAAGNLTNDGINGFTYDGRGRMTGGNFAEYRHNALGQRVLKRLLQGSAFVYTYDEQGHLLEKCDVSGSNACSDWESQVHIWLGDIPVATVLQTLTYNWEGNIGSRYTEMFNVHTDHLSTPRRLTNSGDSTNAVVWRWDGDAFGKGFENGNANNVPDRELYAYDLRFPGQQWDAETWRHYNYFRDYDPSIGRYIQSDPVGIWGGVNTYGYVSASPLRFIDRLGLSEADVGRIENVFHQVVEGMTRRKDRLRTPWLNNVGSTFGGGYLGCGDQESVVRDQLEKQVYDDTWTFTQMSSLFHRWGEAKSSNPADPTIVYDPWRDTITFKYPK